ncbi:ABC transporter substrate-binding protein [Catellatospora sp. KI3]|uniref:ABC transporter substrate-binding protein n=1 Tax=Catellatospora sp. KI3 TaxID=3041620 RepID=UPI00248218A4|nr:ABC transporter substrate-binding protein [Catellatospora sp. KI3]MDI1461723.1 ABC transporter substrate-binding protein [Catellatospora sp. KI3]
MDGLDRRRLLGLLTGAGVAGLTGALSGCTTTPDDSPKSAVRIGLLTPQTGANKAIGVDLEIGFKLYLQLHGSVLDGHPVEIITEDEGDTPKSGLDALKRLHEKQVLAVVGVANPDLLPHVRDTVEAAKIPLLATHTAPAKMPSAIHIWRTAFLSDEPAKAVASYLRRRVMGKVALVGIDNAATGELMDAFISEYGSGANDPISVPTNTKASTAAYAQYADQAANRNPGAIFCNLPTSHIGPFMAALTEAGYKGAVYAPGVSSEGPALEQLGKNAMGLYTAMQYSADLSNLSNHTFSSEFQAQHQRTPTAYAVASYDAAAVLDQALTLAGSSVPTPDKINQSLGNVGQIISPRGNWQFTQGRAPQQKWYLRRVAMDGPIPSNVLISDLATLGA